MKIPVRPNGKGSYLLDVKFKGGPLTSITVDSGAKENVGPKDWGRQFGIHVPEAWMKFRGADGNYIKHHGQRDIIIESLF